MARVSYIEPQNASQEVQQLYEHRLRGKPGAVHKAMAHNPHALTPFLSFYAAVGASLDRKLWEMIYLRVSFLNHCSYCTQHHLASSNKVGLGEADWRNLRDGKIFDYNEAEQAALRYAEKLTKSPGAINDSDIDGLKQFFSEQQIVDLHLLVGLANLTNRFTDPLGLELEFAATAV